MPETLTPVDPPEKKTHPELKLSSALRELLEYSEKSEQGITLGDVIDRTGERAFAVLIAFLCLPFLIVPIPGTSTPFGLALMFLGLQMMLRWDKPWLPKFLRNRRLPKKGTEAVLRGVSKLFRPLEKMVRPRMLFMQSHAAYIIVGAALVIDAILLALPIPIPYTNAPPAWAIFLKSLGNTEDDGVLLIVGMILTVAMIVLVAVFAGATYDAVMASYHSIAGWFGFVDPAATQAATQPVTQPAP